MRLDIGGAEGLTEVLAATDAVVIAAGNESIELRDLPSTVRPRYDGIYLRDGRGWYYCYIHLLSIDPAVKPGERVKMGQKIGVLGKEGNSGGWSHLHFEIRGPQPSGRFGVIEGYAFLWQAYREQWSVPLQAVARPHHLAWAGEEVAFDGSLSRSAEGPQSIVHYQWEFGDGSTAEGPTAARNFVHSGEQSEILKVTDANGRTDYDFSIMLVVEREHPEFLPPTIHAAYWPTRDLKAGSEVVFKVRSFGDGLAGSHEVWNFGDGSPAMQTQSLPPTVDPATGKSTALAKDGYATTTHRFASPGDYLVSVSRVNQRGQQATAHLYVRIEP